MKTNIIILLVTCVNWARTLDIYVVPAMPGELPDGPIIVPRATLIRRIKEAVPYIDCTGQRYDPRNTPSQDKSDLNCYGKHFIAQPPPSSFNNILEYYQRELNLLCKCNEGFVRGPDDNCILPCACPNNKTPEPQEYECDENQHYEACGPSCEKTCVHETSISALLSTSFTTKCFKPNSYNCFCNEGFYRKDNGNGPCVKSCQPEIIPLPFDLIPKKHECTYINLEGFVVKC